jgi:plastocyanin
MTLSPLLRASVSPPLRLALALFFALLVAACGQAATASPVATDQVDLPRSYRFAPTAIKVTVGTTVTWTNDDNFTHSIRLLDPAADPLFMKPGEKVTHVFDTAGSFPYDCSLHPKDMKGTVLVEGASE